MLPKGGGKGNNYPILLEKVNKLFSHYFQVIVKKDFSDLNQKNIFLKDGLIYLEMVELPLDHLELDQDYV